MYKYVCIIDVLDVYRHIYTRMYSNLKVITIISIWIVVIECRRWHSTSSTDDSSRSSSSSISALQIQSLGTWCNDMKYRKKITYEYRI